MYVACKELDLGNRRAPIGGPVPEATEWSYPVLVAHLNLGWLKWVDDKDAPTKPVETETKIVKEKVTKKQVAAEVEGLSCPKCPGRAFTSEKNLKIHQAFHNKK